MIDNTQLAIVRQHDEMDTMTLGKMLAASGYFTDAREAAQAVVKVLAGRELGFPPIASMTGIYIVKGKVSLSANMIAAAIKRTGRYNYKVQTLTDKECNIEFFDGRESLGVSSFTAEDAKRADTQNMGRFPRNMLFARAMSNGAKWFCPDIFGGPIYTPDELGEQVDENGQVTEPAKVVTPVKVLQPPAAVSLAGNGNDGYDDQQPTSEQVFNALPSANQTQPPAAEPPAQSGNGRKAPKMASVASGSFNVFNAKCDELAQAHPWYATKDGSTDKAHILMGAAALGHATITVENAEQVFAELADRAAQHELNQAA